jgi:DNA gyrase subunit B
MRNKLVELGLQDATLEVRTLKRGKVDETFPIKGAQLQELVAILDELGEKIRILRRRGISFADLLEHRDKSGKLPTHWVVLDGKDVFCHGDAAYDKFLREHSDAHVEGEEDAGENGNGQQERMDPRGELHEVRDIERVIGKLKNRKLNIDDYFYVRKEKITGEKEPARFVLSNEDTELEVDNIAGISPAIRELGGRGMEIKRFKGLGEMNADQLWETTMDPNRRTLLRVQAEEAEEAERMFSVLMGDNVETRRQFIEDHALEVKNLDV